MRTRGNGAGNDENDNAPSHDKQDEAGNETTIRRHGERDEKQNEDGDGDGDGVATEQASTGEKKKPPRFSPDPLIVGSPSSSGLI